MYLQIPPHPHIFVVHVNQHTSRLFPPAIAGDIFSLQGHLAVNLTKLAGVNYGKDQVSLKRADYQKLMHTPEESDKEVCLSYRGEQPTEDHSKPPGQSDFLRVNCHYFSFVDDTEARGRQYAVFFEGAKGIYMVLRHRLETLLGLELTPEDQE
ncbi:MAG: hypothetical protein H6728_17685 [Myxococcales bacterium]|nr:hypothetical protein [Myxococcales bacterium]MCB9644907.1 hypothetical protein [Myxococcales bacterium]